MNKSDSIVNLSKALLKAQRSMGAATKGAVNPYFKSRYADYGAVLEVCKDPLNDNGLLVVQPHVNKDGKNFVETTIIHADSGEFISSMTEIICSKEHDAQALGSATTYARRFGLESLLAMPREDDDASAATGKTTKPSFPEAGYVAVVSSPKTASPQVVNPVKAKTTWT